MKDYIQQNKESWEFNVYDFWVKNAGTPEERAAKDTEDPIKMLKKYAAYFDSYEGIRVANICGSCGKKAIPLALLGLSLIHIWHGFQICPQKCDNGTAHGTVFRTWFPFCRKLKCASAYMVRYLLRRCIHLLRIRIVSFPQQLPQL